MREKLPVLIFVAAVFLALSTGCASLPIAKSLFGGGVAEKRQRHRAHDGDAHQGDADERGDDEADEHADGAPYHGGQHELAHDLVVEFDGYFFAGHGGKRWGWFHGAE